MRSVKEWTDLHSRSCFRPLQKSLRYDEKEGNRLAVNFDLLINVLNLRSSDMARALNFDPSYLSRIRTGQRTPRIPPRLRKVWGNFAAPPVRRAV